MAMTRPDIDLHVLMKAMDAIAQQPANFTPDEISAVMIQASQALGRFMVAESMAVDEVLEAELRDAEPEGRA